MKKEVLSGLALSVMVGNAYAGDVEQLVAKQPPEIRAIIWRESSGRPHATRYESHLNDHSVGLMQLLTKTAEGLQQKHPDLPDLGNDTAEALKDPRINIAYGQRLVRDALVKYNGNLDLALASYNSGLSRPLFAGDQADLNTFAEAYGLQFRLVTDGDHGPKTREAMRLFESRWNEEHPEDRIPINGRISSGDRRRIDQLLEEHDLPVEKGVMPQIPHTLRYVEQVKEKMVEYGGEDTVPLSFDRNVEALVGARVYRVEKGDTLSEIAQKYGGMTWEDIAEYNNISNPHQIRAGQMLQIPLTEKGKNAA